MTYDIKRKWDFSSDETKQKCLENIIARYDEVQDGQIGMITAQEVMDIITNAVGPAIYNKGLEDAKKLIQNKLADAEIEIDILKQPV